MRLSADRAERAQLAAFFTPEMHMALHDAARLPPVPPKAQAPKRKPVSYTHLTLPTICSV
eukprot:343513-Alexandrium_andersonii.AAC.1